MQAENPGTMRVLDLIKRHKPSSIRVTMQDGEQKEVEVRGGRSRWTPAARTVQAYGWSRLELLGPKGHVLHVQEGAPDRETAEEPKPGTGEARELHLMRIMNAHADLAVQRHIEALRPTLQAMQAQVSMLAEQLVMERRAAAQTMESAADLAEQLARVAKTVKDEGGTEGDFGTIIAMLPALMKLLPAAPAPAARRPVDVKPTKPPKATVRREAFEGTEPASA